MAYALIVAGGKGTRFGGRRPKQYEPLAGVPVLIRTLRLFDVCAAIDRIVLVVPEGDIPFVRDSMLIAAGLQTKVQIVAGGARRQDSVFKGLNGIKGGHDAVVVIHDAVRPLVTVQCIARCIQTARLHGACITALPAWDTLKRATLNGIIETTLPRERIWLAQTPQAFRINIIRSAHVLARRQEFHGTDDASLVERMGVAVHILTGSHCNIKITTVHDLAFAELLLHAREKADRQLKKGADSC